MLHPNCLQRHNFNKRLQEYFEQVERPQADMMVEAEHHTPLQVHPAAEVPLEVPLASLLAELPWQWVAHPLGLPEVAVVLSDSCS